MKVKLIQLRRCCCDLFSLFISISLLFETSLADVKPKYKPFAGRWAMETQYGDSGHLEISQNQNSARIILAGALGLLTRETSLVATVNITNEAGTAIRITTHGSAYVRIDGKLKIDKETYQIIYGKLRIFDLQSRKHRENLLLATMEVAAYAVSSAQFSRNANLFLDIERAGARGAVAGKPFLLRGIVEAKGPTPVPDQKVFVFMQAPDTLTSMEVVSNNRMSRCGELYNQVQKIRTAWCLLRPLGPGTTDKASFTVRVVPSAEHFQGGGKFKIVMTPGISSGGPISFTARPVRAKATINVKGNSNSNNTPFNKEKCWMKCYYSDGCRPSESDGACQARCNKKCGYI